MDRRPMVAGNWKMNKAPGASAVLAQDVEGYVTTDWEKVDVVLCPAFTGLKGVGVVIELDKVPMYLGGQDVFWEDEGAFTGEVSPPMLLDAGCSYCIVGHSERRQHFGETDETVNLKVKALVGHGMRPIMCVGETLETREAGDTEDFVRSQVMRGLEGVSAEQAGGVVVAYEPIWAIGTGRTPTPEGANDIARTIRATVGALVGPPVAVGTRVLYGGSVTPENAHLFFQEPEIDGALVGGASLDAESFAGIVRAAYA